MRHVTCAGGAGVLGGGGRGSLKFHLASDPKDDHDDCIRQIKRLTSDMTRQSAAFTRELDAMKVCCKP